MPNNPYESPSTHRIQTDDETSDWVEEAKTLVRNQVRVVQLVCSMLISGVGMYLLFSITSTPPRVAAPVSMPLLAGLIGLTVAGLVVGYLLDRTSVGFGLFRNSHDLSKADELVAAACGFLNSRMVISYALREGPAFLSVVMFSLSGNPLLLIPAVLLILSMLVSFPTFGRFFHQLKTLLTA